MHAYLFTGYRRAMVRVATLNVWGTRGDWASRRQALSEGFAALNADVICLQKSIRIGEYDQAADILGPHYIWSPTFAPLPPH